MNIIGLQSIVFILTIDIMFLTTPDAHDQIRSRLAGEGRDAWNFVTLPLNSPWFCLTYRFLDPQALGYETMLLSKPEQIADILSQAGTDFSVDQILLISPGCMNRTESWQMEPLAEVWRGRRSENSFATDVYYLQDGRRYVDSPFDIEHSDLQELTPVVSFNPDTSNKK